MMTRFAWTRLAGRGALLLAVFFASCAHDKGVEATAAPPVVQPAPAVEERAPAGAVADIDGDGVPNDEDACPIEPGLREGEPCADAWGFFFLRVLDVNRLPLIADLSFQPAIRQIVPREDGFSGKLRPGVYRVEASAPGYGSSELTFEVKADQKAFLELVLELDEAVE